MLHRRSAIPTFQLSFLRQEDENPTCAKKKIWQISENCFEQSVCISMCVNITVLLQQDTCLNGLAVGVCLSGKDKYEVPDWDVGKYSIRGAVFPSDCADQMCRMFRRRPTQETRRTHRVQLFREVLCLRRATDYPQSTSASRSDARTAVADCETEVWESHRWNNWNAVGWLWSPQCLRKLSSAWGK